MTKTQLAACFEHVQRQLPLSLSCTETWNGFIAGNTYEACATHHHGRWTLGATDGHGIITPITEGAAHFFEVVGDLPAPPTDDDIEAARRDRDRAQLETSIALFEPPAQPFKKGQYLQWKDGMCNRTLPKKHQAMIVTEVLAASIPADSDPVQPGGNDMCDLRVACIAYSRGREDDYQLIETLVDSRRVEPWGAS